MGKNVALLMKLYQEMTLRVEWQQARGNQDESRQRLAVAAHRARLLERKAGHAPAPIMKMHCLGVGAQYPEQQRRDALVQPSDEPAMAT